MFWHCSCGKNSHRSRGTLTQLWRGTFWHDSRGTSTQFWRGTLRHSCRGKEVHCVSGTLVHTCRGTFLQVLQMGKLFSEFAKQKNSDIIIIYFMRLLPVHNILYI
jgi:hypothetical protein